MSLKKLIRKSDNCDSCFDLGQVYLIRTIYPPGESSAVFYKKNGLEHGFLSRVSQDIISLTYLHGETLKKESGMYTSKNILEGYLHRGERGFKRAEKILDEVKL